MIILYVHFLNSQMPHNQTKLTTVILGTLLLIGRLCKPSDPVANFTKCQHRASANEPAPTVKDKGNPTGIRCTMKQIVKRDLI